MDRPHQRPRFELRVPMPPSEVADRITAALGTDELIIGRVDEQLATLYVRESDQHFWSPHLELTVRPEEDGASLLGRFGPHPAVWTGFMFVYAVLALAATLALMVGLAQITMGSPPWALLGSVAAVALIGFVYGAAFIGRGLGSDQMIGLRLFIEHALQAPPEG